MVRRASRPGGNDEQRRADTVALPPHPCRGPHRRRPPGGLGDHRPLRLRRGDDIPAEAGNALSVPLSKLRHALGADLLRGRTEIELLLPQAAFVDVEAALEGAHRAESAIAEGQ
jgi:hypothetical protein